MRARLALFYSGEPVELREVDLKAVPASLRALKPDNPTVPVLQLPDGRVIDESWDIVLWSVRRNDPEGWLGENDTILMAAEQWIERNDFSFKHDLDHYKYAVRYPEHPAGYYRGQGEDFLRDLEEQLGKSRYLLGEQLSVADIGIFPFIRQFAFVDKDWFDQAPYPRLQHWLEELLASGLFTAIMQKYPLWQPGQQAVIFGPTTEAEQIP
jgi:glutathione S-transferase